MSKEPQKPKGKNTIEAAAADTILQQPRAVEIAGKRYQIAPPTPATLFLVSKQISYLPPISQSTKNVLAEVLSKAKDCRPVTRIAAILVLGAKRINEKHEVEVTRRELTEQEQPKGLQRLFRRRKVQRVTEHKRAMLEIDWLSAQIAENMTIQELSQLVITELGGLGIGDFFGLTASLSAGNLLRPKATETPQAPGA